MKTTFATPDDDDEKNDDEAKPNKKKQKFSFEDQRKHMIFIEALCECASRNYIDRDMDKKFISGLAINQMPRGHEKWDEQAREVWFYARVKYDTDPPPLGLDAADFANEDEVQKYSDWMTFDPKRKLFRTKKEQENDNGPTQ